MVRLTVLEVEVIKFAFCANAFHALDGSPSGYAFSIFRLIVLISGHGGCCIFCSIGRCCIFCILFCRKLKPSCLHHAVYEGIVVAADLFINLIFYHFSVCVKIVPGMGHLRIVAFILQLNPASLHHAVVCFAQVVCRVIDFYLSCHHLSVFVEIIPAFADLLPFGDCGLAVLSVIVPVVLGSVRGVPCVFIFNGDPLVHNPFAGFINVIFINLCICGDFAFFI